MNPLASSRSKGAVTLALAGAALLVLGLLSTGTYHDDDLTHVLFARDAWTNHRLFLDAWGRPGFTLPYALVAWLGDVETGLTACRVLSAALTVATAALLVSPSRQLGAHHPWLAAALYLAMPLVFRAGFAALTETPAAFYVAAGVHLLARGRPRAAAAVLSLVATARLEAIAPLGLLALAWLRRPPGGDRVVPALLLAVGPVLWNAAAFLFFEELPARIYLTSHSGIPEAYGAGSATFFAVRSLEASGLLTLVLAVAGLRILWRAPATPVGLLVAVGWPLWVALQTWLYWKNDHASGGYARFLLPALPLAALAGSVALGRRGGEVALAFTAGLLAVALVHDHDRLVALAPAGVRGALSTGLWSSAGVCVVLSAAAWWARARRVVAGAVVALQLGHLGVSARPFALTPVQEAIAAAVLESRRASPDAPLYAWNVWAGYFDRLATGESNIWYLPTEALGAFVEAPRGAGLVWDAHRARLSPETQEQLRGLVMDASCDAPACLFQRR